MIKEAVEVNNDVVNDDLNENETEQNFIEEIYSQHGGDPRNLDISYCVLISNLPTEFLADTFDQFEEFIKNLLSEEHKLDSSTLKQVIRIPKLESNAADQNKALRALLCFNEKTHKHRMMSRKKDIESTGMQIETLEQLPADILEISDEDLSALEASVDFEMADEVGEDDYGDRDERDEEHEEELDDNDAKTNGNDDENVEKGKNDDKKDGTQEKKLKKKVYEDEDEKAPFEVSWDGAPEFQWRICDLGVDEKKLIIEHLLWADLNNVFIYRCIQRATSVDVSFPMRFSSDASKQMFGKLTLIFPGWVSIMEEAMKHLVFFRSGDGRRIKIFLPQTGTSLKRKEEFEKRLGRLIQPTPRMKEIVVKILPAGYEPTLDDACSWFPNQSVIGCELVHDEMGNPVAVVKIETAEETVAAHASKSFVTITQEVIEKDKDGNEKETKKITNCNVFLRGVEAHFGSLLTFYDQKKKMQEERDAKRRENRNDAPKRPAGSSIRAAPATKRGRRSPLPSRINRGGRGGGNVGRKRSPPSTRRRPMRGGRGPSQRAASSTSAARSSYRSDSSYLEGPSIRTVGRSNMLERREMPFSRYGYVPQQFNERPTVDPFGRPMYGQSGYTSSPFNRGNEQRGYQPQSYDRRRGY